MFRTTLCAAAAAGCLLAGSAHAAIVVGSGTDNEVLNGDLTMSLDIDAGSNVVLLLAVTRRNSLAPTVTVNWSGDGGTADAVSLLVTEDSGPNRSNTIYGIELGTIGLAETVTFNFDSSDGRAVGTALQLSNATLTGAITAKDDGAADGDPIALAATLSGVSSGSFVFANAMRASGGSTITFSAPTETILDPISSGRDTQRVAYDLDVAAGDYNVAASAAVGSSSPDAHLTAVAIAAIPEPGSLALLGLGGLCLLGGRRKRA